MYREKFQLLLNYCVNIICYMMFKAKVSNAHSCRLSNQLYEEIFVKAQSVVADPHHLDADPDLDPTFHFDADPDPCL